jgi:hypothetical protein
MMGRELKSYPCAHFNCNHMIRMNRPKRKTLLNPGVKSARALIKNKCITRLAKQRSMIKNKKLDLLIKPCTTSGKSNSNHPNGSSMNKRAVVSYPFYPGKTLLSF